LCCSAGSTPPGSCSTARARAIAERGENAWKGIVGGTVIRAVFVFRAHRALIGVSPLGI